MQIVGNLVTPQQRIYKDIAKLSGLREDGSAQCFGPRSPMIGRTGCCNCRPNTFWKELWHSHLTSRCGRFAKGSLTPGGRAMPWHKFWSGLADGQDGWLSSPSGPATWAWVTTSLYCVDGFGALGTLYVGGAGNTIMKTRLQFSCRGAMAF